MDRTRTEVDQFGDKGREAGLRWFGHVQRKKSGHIGQKMLKMELPGRRRRADPRECLEYSEGGHKDSWYNIRGRKGRSEMEADDSL